jgi:glycosyltransferase involved in cell wall biosynthesis
MTSVSVTIITKNEAGNIRSCLESVRWASEIVIVDQFSEDGTAEISEKLGARVFQEPWQGFARQKNSAIDKARGPWILSLDADERVPPPLRGEIEKVLARDDALDGYAIARKNFFCGKWIRHGGWYPDYNLRLFRRNAGRFQERTVHEKVVVRGPVGSLRHPLEHYTYKSVADYLHRLERYSRLAAAELASQGRRPRGYSLILRPLFTFFKMYALKGGFLDGRAGLFLAVSYGYYTFLKYYRISEMSARPEEDRSAWQ